MSLIRVFNLVPIISIAFLISACATRPAYSPPSGERFASKPINIERMAIIANMPNEFRGNIAIPITQEFTNVFKQNGLHVRSEVQATNPLALSSDVNFTQAKLFKPNAYLLIKFAGSSTGNGYGNWALIFDLLDEKGRGIWRGSMSLRRLNEMENTSNQVAKEVLQKLIKDQAIEIRPHGDMT